jgi:hypothetical protein
MIDAPLARPGITGVRSERQLKPDYKAGPADA